jgi:hypothetical protein
VAVNLHDAEGVTAAEEAFPAMAALLGLAPGDNATIPFSVCNSSAVSFALEDAAIKRLERQGVDFTWVDWQQGGTKGGCMGDAHNPRMGISHVRVTSRQRRGVSAHTLPRLEKCPKGREWALDGTYFSFACTG